MLLLNTAKLQRMVMDLCCIVHSTKLLVYTYLRERSRSPRSVAKVRPTVGLYSRMLVSVLQLARNRAYGGSRARRIIVQELQLVRLFLQEEVKDTHRLHTMMMW